MTVHGVPEYVFVRGRICAEKGSVRVTGGYGRFVATPLRPPFVYDSIEGKEEQEEKAEEQNTNVAKKKAELYSYLAAQEPPSTKFALNSTPISPKTTDD